MAEFQRSISSQPIPHGRDRSSSGLECRPDDLKYSRRGEWLALPFRRAENAIRNLYEGRIVVIVNNIDPKAVKHPIRTRTSHDRPDRLVGATPDLVHRVTRLSPRASPDSADLKQLTISRRLDTERNAR